MTSSLYVSLELFGSNEIGGFFEVAKQRMTVESGALPLTFCCSQDLAKPESFAMF